MGNWLLVDGVGYRGMILAVSPLYPWSSGDGSWQHGLILAGVVVMDSPSTSPLLLIL